MRAQPCPVARVRPAASRRAAAPPGAGELRPLRRAGELRPEPGSAPPGSREGRTEAAAARGPRGDGVEVRGGGERREREWKGGCGKKKGIKRIQRVGPAAGSWYRE